MQHISWFIGPSGSGASLEQADESGHSPIGPDGDNLTFLFLERSPEAGILVRIRNSPPL